ncbi:MAG: phosphatase [Spirochaetaceae bacterium]|nr:phosphatase [Spirochaetaceae bacterium]|tara:strand:- start:25924 stop:26523 length:600 start_codon:yes stop_codon:yes gene_type:complete
MPNPSTWIFDMDGTLTEAVHDFQLIRRELGLGPEDPILDSIRNAEPDKARQMNHRLNEIEWELAALARPAAGIHEFLLGLKEGNVRLGILTRNRHDIALETLKRAGLSEFFQEDWIVDREMAAPKPDPEGIHLILERHNERPENTMMVGDFRYDLEAGRAAGTGTVYMDPTGEFPFRDLADICARDFLELKAMISGHLP